MFDPLRLLFALIMCAGNEKNVRSCRVLFLRLLCTCLAPLATSANSGCTSRRRAFLISLASKTPPGVTLLSRLTLFSPSCAARKGLEYVCTTGSHCLRPKKFKFLTGQESLWVKLTQLCLHSSSIQVQFGFFLLYLMIPSKFWLCLFLINFANKKNHLHL